MVGDDEYSVEKDYEQIIFLYIIFEEFLDFGHNIRRTPLLFSKK